jgi:DNA-directed RNA polymerase
MAWRDSYTRSQRMNDKRMSQMFALRSTLASAERFKGRPLWFPIQLDARGRAYPMSTFGLSPQGSGYQKALLMSYESRPILTEADRNSLYFQCATEGEHDGIDKASTAARVKWVEDNLQTILEVGEDYRNHVSFWADSGSPWMFLAACREIYEFHQHGYGFESRLFCYQDATCSGLQVFSALGRDEVGGFATNLVPGHARQDIYGLVAERAMEKLRNMDISSHDSTQRRIHSIVLARGLDRSATKRQVMTRPYNAKMRSCVDYTLEWYKKQVAEGHVELPKDRSITDFSLAKYVAPVIWDAIVEAIPAANRMMVYIEDCIKMTVKANPEAPIQWSLPDGMVCIIDKQNQASAMIQTRINSSMHKRSVKEDTGIQSPRQHGNAGPPNFIHSLDALHLRETARLWEDKCAAQGRKPIYTFVHDSFAVPAADMPEFSKTIREAFVKIHTQWDFMGDLVECLQEIAGPDVVFPPRPDTGNLDLSGVLTSEFFFS